MPTCTASTVTPAMRSAASTAERMHASALSRCVTMPAFNPSARVWSKPSTSNCTASPLPSNQSGAGQVLAIRQQILLVPISSAVTMRWRLLLIVVVWTIPPVPSNSDSSLAFGLSPLCARCRQLLRRGCVTWRNRCRLMQPDRDAIEQAQINCGDIALKHAVLLLQLVERGECLVDVVVWQHDLDPGFELQRPAPVADLDRAQHPFFQLRIADENSKELGRALAGALAHDKRKIGIGVAKRAGEHHSLIVDHIGLPVFLPYGIGRALLDCDLKRRGKEAHHLRVSNPWNRLEPRFGRIGVEAE